MQTRTKMAIWVVLICGVGLAIATFLIGYGLSGGHETECNGSPMADNQTCTTYSTKGRNPVTRDADEQVEYNRKVSSGMVGTGVFFLVATVWFGVSGAKGVRKTPLDGTTNSAAQQPRPGM